MAVFENELLVARGAEAELFKSEYLSLPVLVKRRVPKSYRNPVLDSRIRSERTVAEARLLHNAKAFGVRVPAVLRIDKANAEIAMEFVPGKRVKDVLTKKNFKKICAEIGASIGKIHCAGIVHGDLTTSNILIHNDSLVFIDFGLASLSQKTEDRAVDLLVFKKTFEATHCNLLEGWQFIVKGYLKEFPHPECVKQIGKIEARARYL
ncbi:MAG: Kae1-associated serine/threonine protein kinase [Candidatus Diapherotrites archaeon]|nr:Kae1-associated serine/threonine protein kinase [Candidatus Diapherotrites archaeon]